MLRASAFSLVAASLLLAACPGEDPTPSPSDASEPAVDGGGLPAPDGSAQAPDASDPAGPDAAAPGPDAGTEPADAALAPPDGGSVPTCAAAGPGCTCVLEPADPSLACWHSFGGRYSNHACSAAYQCCDGVWTAGQSACGACACVEETGEIGCVPAAAATTVCFPEFDGTAAALPADVRQSMTGVSWKAGCPVGLDALSLLSMPHWGFDGAVHQGVMVVAASVADDVLAAFRRVYEARFPIERMKLVDEYGGSDDLSMGDNNTSAFNCRPITGGSSYSQHSYGTAIDINPVQNPYISGSTVLPPAASAYVDRNDERPGMIIDLGPVTGAFRSITWYWGGEWATPKDYQHFSSNDL